MKKWYEKMAGILALVVLFTIMHSCKADEKTSDSEVTTQAEQQYNDLLDRVSNMSFEETLDEYSENTLIDEVLEIETEEIKELKEIMYQGEYIDFETAVQILDELSETSKNIKETISEEAKETLDKNEGADFTDIAGDMTPADAKDLIEAYKTSTDEVEKARMLELLTAYEDGCDSWIEKYGLNICERLLKLSIKAKACEVSGLEPVYYGVFTISPEISTLKQITEPYATISGHDPISGEELQYDVDDYHLAELIGKLYNIQSIKDCGSAHLTATTCADMFDVLKRTAVTQFSDNGKGAIVKK